MVFKRGFFLVLGLCSLLAGILGIVLPLLPTVPFILLSGYCFARSSERLHTWLHQHPWFADALYNWEKQRALKRPLKRKAMVMTLISFAISIAIVPLIWVKLMLACMCSVLMVYLYQLPVIDTE